MIFKIITVISLVKVCVGDVPPQPLPQSNQAISSQSFVRHDVPLSYKYNWVHIYTTPKPDQNKHKPIVPQHHQVRQQPPQIQYAPIHNEQANQQPITLNAIPESTHLEPKPSQNRELINHEHMPHMEKPEHLSYVPGYNIELLQAVNRYPGHNAVYRSYPNMSPNEKLNKINFLNQYVLQEKEYIQTTQTPQQQEVTPYYTTTKQTIARPKTTTNRIVPKHYGAPKPEPFQIIQSAGYASNIKTLPIQQSFINLQDYLPHPKTHRMLLNIARTYNIAQTPLKGQHAALMIKNMPTHTQALIQIRNPSEADKNSLLSVQNKNLYSLPVHQVP